MMKNKPSLTIAIPTYKREKLLKAALDSALAQETSRDYRVIVVDNDTDKNGAAGRLLLEHYGNVSNLTYYKNPENLGMYGNINRCYHLAGTEWVALLHDDDFLANDYVEKVLELIDTYNCCDAFGIMPTVLSEKMTLYCKAANFFSYLCHFFCAPIRSVTLESMAVSNQVYQVGFVCRKSSFLSVGGYDQDTWVADYNFYVKLLRAGFNMMRYQKKSLGYYRVFVNESRNPDTALSMMSDVKKIRLEIIRSVACPLHIRLMFFLDFSRFRLLNIASEILRLCFYRGYVTVKKYEKF